MGHAYVDPETFQARHTDIMFDDEMNTADALNWLSRYQEYGVRNIREGTNTFLMPVDPRLDERIYVVDNIGDDIRSETYSHEEYLEKFAGDVFRPLNNNEY